MTRHRDNEDRLYAACALLRALFILGDGEIGPVEGCTLHRATHDHEEKFYVFEKTRVGADKLLGEAASMTELLDLLEELKIV